MIEVNDISQNGYWKRVKNLIMTIEVCDFIEFCKNEVVIE